MQVNFPRLRSPHQQGFTLLELLVVVVIVAILFTYTTLAIRSTTPEDLIKEEANRLERLVQLAMEEAVLRGEEYGIEVFTDGYRFLRQSEGQWLAIENDRLLRQRELPADMEIELHTDETGIDLDFSKAGAVKKYMDETSDLNAFMADTTLGDDDNETGDEEKNKTKPQVFLLSSEEITPEFDIRFYILGVETSYIVKGLFDGTLSNEVSDL